MSNLAREEIYFQHFVTLDETLEGVEKVTRDDMDRVAQALFAEEALAATVLGDVNGLTLPRERLALT
jgi:predicted Zn-dependent peptidase